MFDCQRSSSDNNLEDGRPKVTVTSRQLTLFRFLSNSRWMLYEFIHETHEILPKSELHHSRDVSLTA